ncbi:MAG: hypothetical protein ACK5DE_14015 [Bacteroidota bacterium]|jgi:hypothetical protein
MNDTIDFNDFHYALVRVEGLKFATLELIDALFDEHGDPVSIEAEEIDKSIDYYFEESTFYSNTIQQLLNKYYEVRNHQNI